VYAVRRRALWELAGQADAAGQFASDQERKQATRSGFFVGEPVLSRRRRSAAEGWTLAASLVLAFALSVQAVVTAPSRDGSSRLLGDPGAGQTLADPGTGHAHLGLASAPACQATSTNADGKVNWSFCDLAGRSLTWGFPLEDYQKYGRLPHPRTPLALQTPAGTVVHVNDMRPYVTPGFFHDVIDDLTTGRTAEQFVQEAFNLKAGFVHYASSYLDEQKVYQYPAETMTTGQGICGDTTILLASLLVAGNDQAHYGMKVQVYYAEMNQAGDGIVIPPTTANHAFVGVTYQDGGREFIETTAPAYSSWEQVQGWDYDVSGAAA
jgi:hypothetical protein